MNWCLQDRACMSWYSPWEQSKSWKQWLLRVQERERERERKTGWRESAKSKRSPHRVVLVIFLKQAVLFWISASGGWSKSLQLKLLQAWSTRAGRERHRVSFVPGVCSSIGLRSPSSDCLICQQNTIFCVFPKAKIIQEYQLKSNGKKTAWGERGFKEQVWK